jgi:hypothetical protein
VQILSIESHNGGAQVMLICVLHSIHLPITSSLQTMPQKNLKSTDFLHTNQILQQQATTRVRGGTTQQ